MKWIVNIITYIFLSVLLVGIILHFFTAVPVIVDTNKILIIISAVILVLLIVGMRISNHKNSHLIFLVISICCLLYSLYNGFWGFTKKDILINSNDIKLAASLYEPNSGCLCPGIVFVHGSGPMTRNEYKYFAMQFAKNGIVSVIIYDKRGTGDSEGHLYGGGYTTYSEDASNIFKYLSNIEAVGRKGFIGFSEGEWVVPMAIGNLVEKPDFLIIVGASGLSPADQVNEEIEIRLENKGFSDEEIAEALEINDAVYNFQRNGTKKDSLINALTLSNKQPILIAANDIPLNKNELGEYDDYEWWRSVMDTEPKKLWEKANTIETKILFVKGEIDNKSYSNRTKKRLSAYLEEFESERIEFKNFKNADHMILEWPFGENVPPPIFANNYLTFLMDWIKNNEK